MNNINDINIIIDSRVNISTIIHCGYNINMNRDYINIEVDKKDIFTEAIVNRSSSNWLKKMITIALNHLFENQSIIPSDDTIKISFCFIMRIEEEITYTRIGTADVEINNGNYWCKISSLL